MIEAVDRYEEADLPEHQKVALRLVDAFVIDPRRVDDELRRQAHEHFSPEQLVEIALDIVSWTQQKVLVALDLDAPVDPTRLMSLSFDELGRFLVS